MLLQHILWQQPDQQSRITDFLLSQISEDDGLQSASYILGSEFLAYRLVAEQCGRHATMAVSYPVASLHQHHDRLLVTAGAADLFE